MGTHIKGTSLIARIHYLEEEKGAEVKRRVLDSLSAADREQLSRLLLPVREYPLELNARLDDAIARVIAPGEPVERVYRQLGRVSAERNVRDFHAGFSVGDPHEV